MDLEVQHLHLELNPLQRCQFLVDPVGQVRGSGRIQEANLVGLGQQVRQHYPLPQEQGHQVLILGMVDHSQHWESFPSLEN